MIISPIRYCRWCFFVLFWFFSRLLCWWPFHGGISVAVFSRLLCWWKFQGGTTVTVFSHLLCWWPFKGGISVAVFFLSFAVPMAVPRRNFHCSFFRLLCKWPFQGGVSIAVFLSRLLCWWRLKAVLSLQFVFFFFSFAGLMTVPRQYFRCSFCLVCCSDDCSKSVFPLQFLFYSRLLCWWPFEGGIIVAVFFSFAGLMTVPRQYFRCSFFLVCCSDDHSNKCQKDCLWKQRTYYRSENGSLGYWDSS